MKTFFYSISFLALLASPVSCTIEEIYSNQEKTTLSVEVVTTENTLGIDSTIDPPIMPTKP